MVDKVNGGPRQSATRLMQRHTAPPEDGAQPCPFCHAVPDVSMWFGQKLYGCSDLECPAFMIDAPLAVWNRRKAN